MNTEDYTITKTGAKLGAENRHFSGTASECRDWITASENADADDEIESLKKALENLLVLVEADAGNGSLSDDYDAAIFSAICCARHELRNERG